MKDREVDMGGSNAEQFYSAECIITVSIDTFTVNETEEDCP